ncbi:hypothetical protein B1R44_10715 [Serratia marcescens]|nr:hypothetical protein B1R44_10715 [Serratia marcescens]
MTMLKILMVLLTERQRNGQIALGESVLAGMECKRIFLLLERRTPKIRQPLQLLLEKYRMVRSSLSGLMTRAL